MRRPEPYPLVRWGIRVTPAAGFLAPKIYELGMRPFMPSDGTFIGLSATYWAWLGIAWLGGLLVAELTNPDSLTVRWLRWRLRICDVRDVIPVSQVIGGIDYVLVTVLLHFRRNSPSTSIAVEVQGAVSPTRGALQPATLVYERNRPFLASEDYKLVVATIPIAGWPKTEPEPAPHFGELGRENPPRLSGPLVNILTVKIESGARWQSYKIYLRTTTKDGSARGRIFCMGEDHDAFETAKGPAFT